MIGDALAGSFDVLVVHKLDRFARNLRITLEYFDKLSKAGISFLSINENMDFSTPWGRLALTLLGGLAQFYSDNLSQETKKGWAERKEQGLYAGLLPFGIMKGDSGIRIQNPETYPGLVMAFELAAQGKTDRQVCQALNAAGYRTAGNQGNRLLVLRHQPYTSPKDVFCLQEKRMVNGYRKISLFNHEIAVPNVPLREEVDVRLIPDKERVALEVRIWRNNRMVHSVAYPLREFPRVHFSTLPNIVRKPVDNVSIAVIYLLWQMYHVWCIVLPSPFIT